MNPVTFQSFPAARAAISASPPERVRFGGASKNIKPNFSGGILGNEDIHQNERILRGVTRMLRMTIARPIRNLALFLLTGGIGNAVLAAKNFTEGYLGVDSFFLPRFLPSPLAGAKKFHDLNEMKGTSNTIVGRLRGR